MKYTVKAYYSTGFNKENIPDSPALLLQCTSRTFSDVYHWQSSELSYVDISATYEDVADADYLQIGSSYYFITKIEMMSETRCARVYLSLDALTTMGGTSNIEFSDGWLERAHVSDDTMFSNTMNEPFSPQEPLIVEEGDEIGNDTTGENTKILVSTVDLADVGNVAYTYSIGDYSVTCPVPKQADKDTVFEMPNLLNYGYDTVSSTLPFTTSYVVTSATKQKIGESLGQLQGIGAIESCISYFYIIPSSYLTYSADDNGYADRIIGSVKTQETNLKFKYLDGIKNNKVFSIFNTYNLSSISTGNSAEYESYIISEDGEEAPKFRFFIDPSPRGKTFCRPRAYNKNTKNLLLGCVAGGEWINSPISASGKSGYAKSEYSNKAKSIENLKHITEPLPTELGGYDTAVSQSELFFGKIPEEISNRISSIVGNIARNKLVGYKGSMEVDAVAPSMFFPSSISNQTYLGNGFYVTRKRLTDNDAKRLDRFLTMYGYSVYKHLEKSDTTNRTYFNYIKASSVNIKGKYASKRIREIGESQLMNGVRIWHVLPDSSYYSNNPIA